MNIILLTHQKELNKKTNTGSLVVDVMGEKARVVVWDRVNPNAELLRSIDEGSVALLYPSADSQFINQGPDYENYIIIDGTWQQARGFSVLANDLQVVFMKIIESKESQ